MIQANVPCDPAIHDAAVQLTQVWHDRGWPQTRPDHALGGAPSRRFPADDANVANVQANGQHEAVRTRAAKPSSRSGSGAASGG